MQCPCIHTPNCSRGRIPHLLHIPRCQKTMPQNSQHRLHQLPRQRNPTPPRIPTGPRNPITTPIPIRPLTHPQPPHPFTKAPNLHILLLLLLKIRKRQRIRLVIQLVPTRALLPCPCNHKLAKIDL